MVLRMIIRSNLKSKKSVYIGLFLLMFLITVVLSTVVSVNLGQGERMKEALTIENTGDILTFIHDAKFTNELRKQINESSLVESVDITKSICTDSFAKIGESAKFEVYLSGFESEKSQYHIFNESFTSFKKNETKIQPGKGEIFLPVAMKSNCKITIGDEILISLKSGDIKLKVANFIEEPTLGCSLIGYKIAVINKDDFENLTNDSRNKENMASIVRIKVNSTYEKQLNKAFQLLTDETGIGDVDDYTISKSSSYSFTMLYVQMIQGILWAFSILLFVIVLIIVGHSITTSIEMDYKNFGIYKSYGLTSKQLRKILICQYLITTGIAMVAGMCISIVIIPLIHGILLPITGILVNKKLILLPILLISCIVLAFIYLYAYFKSRKVVQISPVQAITGGKGPVYFKKHIDLSITKRFPTRLSMKLILKQIINHANQYITTIIIIALLVFFTMSVTSLKQIISSKNSEKLFGGFDSDILLNYNPQDTSLVDDVMDSIEEKYHIVRKLYSAVYYTSLNGNNLLVRVGQKGYYMQEPLEGRKPMFDNEIMITGILEDEMGIHIGDQVTVKYQELQKPFIVTGIYQDMSDVGRNYTMLDIGFQTISPDFQYKEVKISLDSHDQSAECAEYLNKKYASEVANKELTIIDSYTRWTESSAQITLAVNTVTGITYIFVLIFGAVVTFMICQKRFFQEKIDLGIYKSIGFTASSLRWQFTVRFMLIVLFGCIVGTLGYVCFGDMLLSILLRSIGMVQYITYYTPSLILIPIGYVMICTLISAFGVSRRIKRVSCKNSIME